ncbi:MAG: hypothetical protein LC637_11625 [Xanthomonadaceae bacterium]|nr:hypothetical protein [Xanthomonadaceae bacterium]
MAVTLLLAACVLPVAAELTQAGRVDPGLQTSAAGQPQALRQRLLDAAGLERLAGIEPGASQRETRIWQLKRSDGVNALLRLMHSEHGADGEWLFFWPIRSLDLVLFAAPDKTTHDVARFWLAGRCDRFVRADAIGYCRARFHSPPDWALLSQRLPDFGSWLQAPPGHSELAGPAIDLPAEQIGWTRMVETGFGPSHRVVTNEATAESGPRADCPKNGLQCPHLSEAPFKTLDALVYSMLERRLQPVEPGPLYSGRIAAAESRTFEACGTHAVRVLPQRLADLTAQAGLELPRPGALGYRVTLRGRVVPEWMRVRVRGKAVAPPQLVLGSLITVDPAAELDCTTGSN